MWPSNLVLPKMNMTKVTGPLNSDKNRVETSRTVDTGRTDSSRNSQSARPDSARTLSIMEKFGSLGVETDMPLPEIAPVVTAIPENTVTVVPPQTRRNIKKSREERYSSDMQDNENKVILPSISSYSEATTENVTSSAVSSSPMVIENGLNATTSLAPTPRMPLTKIDSKLSDISQVKFLCKGSHSRVFKGVYQNKTIVIKVLADSSVNKSIAQMEFKLEKDILSRINHTNILNIIGCGEVSSKLYPSGKRPLMILEALTGGTLAYHLNKHKQQLAALKNTLVNEEIMNTKLGIAMASSSSTRPLALSTSSSNNNSMVHSIMPFTELQFIRMAKQFADALHYLHEKFGPNITLIHRDLKPDNIGFSDDGVLKLMDFGLSTTVKKNASENDVYELSGCTGSYRYMAPEVALNKSYNEKVDIYSYGLILYEMLTGVTPFQEDCKETFYIKVVYGHERPSFDHDEFHNPITTLPALKLGSVEVEDGFHLKRMKCFIELCWHPVYSKRPTAQEALVLFTELENILVYGSNTNTNNNGRTMMRCSSGSELDTITSYNASYNSHHTGGGDSTYSDDDTVARETKKNRIVKNYSNSMLASHGEYSWTKDSVNTGASNGNNNNSNSHDNSMDHERNIYENNSNNGGNGNVGMASSSSFSNSCQTPQGVTFSSNSTSSSSVNPSTSNPTTIFPPTTAATAGSATCTMGSNYYSMGIACTSGCATSTTAAVSTANNNNTGNPTINATLPPVPQAQTQQQLFLFSSPPPTPQKFQQQNNQNMNNGVNMPTFSNNNTNNNYNNNTNNYQKTAQQLQHEKEAYLKHTMSTSSCYSVNSYGDLIPTNNNDANSSVNSAVVNDVDYVNDDDDDDGNHPHHNNHHNHNNIRNSSAVGDEQIMVMMNENIPTTTNNNNNNNNSNNYDTDNKLTVMMQSSSTSPPPTTTTDSINSNNNGSANLFRRGYESLVKQFAKPY